jgi:hypothetical protein
MRTMHELLDEALDEATGRSSRRFALVLVCLLFGAVLALWLTRRQAMGGQAAEPVGDAPPSSA